MTAVCCCARSHFIRLHNANMCYTPHRMIARAIVRANERQRERGSDWEKILSTRIHKQLTHISLANGKKSLHFGWKFIIFYNAKNITINFVFFILLSNSFAFNLVDSICELVFWLIFFLIYAKQQHFDWIKKICSLNAYYLPYLPLYLYRTNLLIHWTKQAAYITNENETRIKRKLTHSIYKCVECEEEEMERQNRRTYCILCKCIGRVSLFSPTISIYHITSRIYWTAIHLN